ncbi:SDR family NAD(P)-dependent oxidoreductase [Streptomyces sp. NPDC050743]|uniref:SDR family NAD(P)-dependent oxidoreductase n=1 Tax=Streptomyces sp. NPDC050743 TaxID=3365634 RepID=UPI00379886BA
MKRIDRFDGRVAVVTGGASGIGRGIAENLLAAAATVVVADVDAAAARRTAADIGAIAEVVDVTDAADVQALADRVVKRHGRVDVVVNNAGVGPLATFDDLLPADFHWVMDVNFWGVVHGLKSFLPLLQANPEGGYIVNTASVAAVVAAPGTTAYAASKAAVVAVSEVLAAELDQAGQVGVSILLPGLVRTNINANAVKRPGHRESGSRTEDFLPTMTVLEPTQVGAMVVDAMRSGRLHVFTHPETRQMVTARSDALAAAFTA